MRFGAGAANSGAVVRRAEPITYEIDDYDLPRFVQEAAGFGMDRYAFVVTPNVDHFVSLQESASYRALYAQAAYVLLDSRVVALTLRFLRGLRIPVCRGSDLTAALITQVVAPTDPIVLIGCSDQQAQMLRERFGLQRLQHHNPPMGFIKDPAAVEACLQFIESASPFRFCLIAVGNPPGVMVAHMLAERGRARGLALTIGASIDFLTGKQKRAPVWMQQAGLECLYRLIHDPRRLAGRYLVKGPRFFAYLGAINVVLRPARPR
jgi:exopolysaccharide biosynthesis WecB/TagA/CpsF family protein